MGKKNDRKLKTVKKKNKNKEEAAKISLLKFNRTDSWTFIKSE